MMRSHPRHHIEMQKPCLATKARRWRAHLLDLSMWNSSDDGLAVGERRSIRFQCLQPSVGGLTDVGISLSRSHNAL